MTTWFKPKKTPKELAKEAKRETKREVRVSVFVVCLLYVVVEFFFPPSSQYRPVQYST
jgi:hypothetical protein